MARRSLFPAILALFALLSGCAPNPSAPSSSALSTTPQELRVAIPFGLKSLDPVISPVTLMRTGLAETLFRIDRDGSVQPWLASGFRQLDELRWQIAIRPGVTFHNGEAVDAAGVKASLERSIQKNALAPGLLRASSIEVNEEGLLITTEKAHPALIQNLAHPVFIIANARVAEDPAGDVANRPILTGPYRVKQFQPDQYLTAERNPQHWAGPPAFAQVTTRFITDPNTRSMALQSGEVDLAQDIPVEAVSNLRQNPDLLVDTVVGLRVSLIQFNVTKPPFDDARVRRAVSLAIDRQALAQQVMMGHATPATGLFPSSLPFGGVETNEVDFRREEARRLLDQAGWTESGNQGRSRDGAPLSVTLLSYPQRPELNLMAETIQSYLAAVGIQVRLQVVQDIESELRKGTYDLSMWTQLTAPTGDPLFMLDSFLRSGAPTNYMGYSSSALDMLINQLAVTFDQAGRNQAAVEAQQVLIQESPITPLLYQQVIVGRHRNLAGFAVHPMDFYLVTGALNWQAP